MKKIPGVEGTMANKDDQINISETKLKIMEASLRLFSEKGFKGTSIREIAKTVGIKGSSIYNHFSSKEDILKSLFSRFGSNSLRASLMDKSNLQFLADNPHEFPSFFKKSARQLFLDENWKKFFKVILAEMIHNDSARKIFREEMLERGREIVKTFFTELKKMGLLKDYPVSKMETTLFSPLILFNIEYLLSGDEEEEAFLKKIDEYIDFVWTILKK